MNAIIKFLDGKKTIIGAIAANLVPWLIIKGYMGNDTAVMVMGIVNAVTGFGLAHKAYKASQAPLSGSDTAGA